MKLLSQVIQGKTTNVNYLNSSRRCRVSTILKWNSILQDIVDISLAFYFSPFPSTNDTIVFNTYPESGFLTHFICMAIFFVLLLSFYSISFFKIANIFVSNFEANWMSRAQSSRIEIHTLCVISNWMDAFTFAGFKIYNSTKCWNKPRIDSTK